MISFFRGIVHNLKSVATKGLRLDIINAIEVTAAIEPSLVMCFTEAQMLATLVFYLQLRLSAHSC